MKIRETTPSDLADILQVERAAFGQDEEANLVKALLSDVSAKPTYSLLAFENDQPVGHILFTAGGLQTTEKNLSISLLAPLAVIPDFQKQGIGGMLIQSGLKHLRKMGVELVFVLGHPTYYPRYGFTPAGVQGLEAPFLISEENENAWMVQELKPGVLANVSGKVRCADKMNKSEFWVE